MTRYATSTHRRDLLDGILDALRSLKTAGCRVAYLDGSFVTAKKHPRDFDACWNPTGVVLDRLDAHDARDPRELPANVDPGMRQLMHNAIAGQIETLRRQIEHYEKLRDGQITSREITSLRELPTALIEARIAARLTQRQLAERIDVAE